MRAFVAWLPFPLVAMLLLIAGLAAGTDVYLPVSGVVALLAISLIGVVYAIARPDRGLQDIAAGTYLIPN